MGSLGLKAIVTLSPTRFDALQRNPNVHLETSCVMGYDATAKLVGQCGSAQILECATCRTPSDLLTYAGQHVGRSLTEEERREYLHETPRPAG